MFSPVVQQQLQMQMGVRQVERAGISSMIIVLAGIIIALVALYLFRRWKTKKYFAVGQEQHAVQHPKEMPSNFSLGMAPEMERHLKEDERLVVEVLKAKQSRCSQGTLRISTNFSKAKLSRLLKELEDRKIIVREKEGKKNLVYLKG